MLRVIASLVLLASTAAFAQQSVPGFPREPRPESSEDARIRHEREKAMNQKRQGDLKRDTDKLLQLATELKENVDKTNENILSLDVIKKAEEIEKLAKSIRDKMKAQALEPMPGTEPRRFEP
jgi:hypothetical protein